MDIILEAEDAVVVGAKAVWDHPSVPGVDFVDYVSSSGDYVEWTVSVPATGVYTLEFRYALISGDRPLQVLVNGSEVEASLSFPATGSWTEWGSTSTTATLNTGTNTVRAVAIGSSGANIDYLRVTD